MSSSFRFGTHATTGAEDDSTSKPTLVSLRTEGQRRVSHDEKDACRIFDEPTIGLSRACNIFLCHLSRGSRAAMRDALRPLWNALGRMGSGHADADGNNDDEDDLDDRDRGGKIVRLKLTRATRFIEAHLPPSHRVDGCRSWCRCQPPQQQHLDTSSDGMMTTSPHQITRDTAARERRDEKEENALFPWLNEAEYVHVFEEDLDMSDDNYDEL